ncbi:hydroxysteroid 11-beta-dehydrogenase 1-like protein [Rhinatrema bivittatum]|uniref:hydroxysteroid 11-beta-dehydrogenase 1-like protein n=1 Tax=Rhinatrema bivittatum TaxID=194408 RepID=UPI00112AF77E|nr:hydroxysteroid 11-beta-dehydrogenase 1-like protein [Rhinatrema bivittatum]
MRRLTQALCLAGLIGILAFYWRDPFDSGRLAGARVLLTGASGGIGEEMAYHYSSLHAELVITARKEAALQKVMEKCLELGARKVLYIPADMSLPQDPERVMQFAVQELGGLDYVVLNHIGETPYRMWEGDVDHMRWLMQVNFLSYVALASATLPALAKSKGSLLVVSSLTGKIPTPYTTSYSATKFALEGFFGSLRHELIMRGVDVSITLCILGLVDTKSAMEKIKGVVLSMPVASANEAALTIIKGGVSRAREIYYPWWVKPLCHLKDWFPDQQDWVLRSFYNYSRA